MIKPADSIAFRLLIHSQLLCSGDVSSPALVGKVHWEICAVKRVFLLCIVTYFRFVRYHCIGVTSIKIYFISLEFNYARFKNIVFSEGLLSA